MIANRQNPFLGALLIVRGVAGRLKAFISDAWPAAIDEVTDVYRLFATQNDVIAAGRERVTGSNDDSAVSSRIAGAAHYFQTANNATSEQVPVMQTIFRCNIIVEAIEIFIGQKLTGKEPRTAQAFESTASGAYGAGIAKGRRTAVECAA